MAERQTRQTQNLLSAEDVGVQVSPPAPKKSIAYESGAQELLGSLRLGATANTFAGAGRLPHVSLDPSRVRGGISQPGIGSILFWRHNISLGQHLDAASDTRLTRSGQNHPTDPRRDQSRAGWA